MGKGRHTIWWRFNRLTLWNKIAAVAAIITILWLPVTVGLLWLDQSYKERIDLQYSQLRELLRREQYRTAQHLRQDHVPSIPTSTRTRIAGVTDKVSDEDRLLLRAMKYLADGEPELARRLIQDAISEASANLFDVYNEAGDIEYLNGNYGRAISHYENAYKQDRNSDSTLDALIAAMLRHGQHAELEQLIKREIELVTIADERKPSRNCLLHANLAGLRLVQRKFANAEEELRVCLSIIELIPETLPLVRYTAYGNMGSLKFLVGEYDEAADFFRLAIVEKVNLQDNDVAMHGATTEVFLAATYFRSGDSKAAEKELVSIEHHLMDTEHEDEYLRAQVISLRTAIEMENATDPAQKEIALTEGLLAIRAEFGEDALESVPFRISLAQEAIKTEDYEKAKRITDTAISIQSSVPGLYNLNLANLYLLSASVNVAKGDHTMAAENTNAAKDILVQFFEQGGSWALDLAEKIAFRLLAIGETSAAFRIYSRAFSEAKHDLRTAPRLSARLLNNFAAFCISSECHKLSREYLEESKKLLQGIAGEEALLIIVNGNLATLEGKHENYETATTLLLENIETVNNTPGLSKSFVPSLYITLAEIAIKAADVDEATAYAVKALKAPDSGTDISALNRSESKRILAKIAIQKGDYATAEKTHAAGLALLEQIYARHSDQIASYVFAYADTFRLAGRHRDANRVAMTYLEAVQASDNALSRSMNRKYDIFVADTLRGIKRLVEARKMTEELLSTSSQFGESVRTVSAIRNNLALTLFELGERNRAFQIFEDVIQELTDEVGESHWQTKRVQHNFHSLFFQNKPTFRGEKSPIGGDY